MILGALIIKGPNEKARVEKEKVAAKSLEANKKKEGLFKGRSNKTYNISIF